MVTGQRFQKSSSSLPIVEKHLHLASKGFFDHIRGMRVKMSPSNQNVRPKTRLEKKGWILKSWMLGLVPSRKARLQAHTLVPRALRRFNLKSTSASIPIDI